MNEVQILLSDEQMKQLGNNVYTIMLKNINQVHQDTALDKRYLTKKERNLPIPAYRKQYFRQRN